MGIISSILLAQHNKNCMTKLIATYTPLRCNAKPVKVQWPNICEDQQIAVCVFAKILSSLQIFQIRHSALRLRAEQIVIKKSHI